MKRRTTAKSPSNIAFIKYMGKIDPSRNSPANSSLSMTLDSLASFVSLTDTDGTERFIWKGEKPIGVEGDAPHLDPKGVEKFLKFSDKLLTRIPTILRSFGVEPRAIPESMEIRTSNTFPHSAGIASSASAFSALTLAMLGHLAADRRKFDLRFAASEDFRASVAVLSQEGSGSSSRSFFGPFCAWTGDDVFEIKNGLPPLKDLVILAGREKKAVSSSDAHHRVRTSPLWATRPGNADRRWREIQTSIEQGDFDQVAYLTIEDGLEMHELFHTSEPPFTYWNDETRAILDRLAAERKQWQGVLFFTLDAGPNVHLIHRASDAPRVQAWIKKWFPHLDTLMDDAGTGAKLLP